MSLAFVAGATAAVSTAQVNGAGRTLNQAGLSQFTTGYMENKGQWDPQARFRTTRNGLDFWMTDKGFVFDFHKYEKGSNSKFGAGDPADASGINLSKEGQVVRMEMVGATGTGKGEGFQPTNQKMDFFLGSPEKHARGVQSLANLTSRTSFRAFIRGATTSMAKSAMTSL